VILTARGRKVVEQSFHGLHTVQAKLLEALNPRERAALTSDLARLLEALVADAADT
jgi:DNA-binding MarR family transcriptional regulator